MGVGEGMGRVGARPGTDTRAYKGMKARAKRDMDPTCHLCREHIDRDLKYPHPRSWTYDHITPLARGGEVMGPGLPAHSRCNIQRGDKLLSELNSKEYKPSQIRWC